MSQTPFEYYAFISYNHKDRAWAQRLQRQLQRYRLPTALLKGHPSLPKRITPVFLDETDLVAVDSGLKQSLREKLDASNYLIVLCSPNSAGAPWVNAEVQHFIDTGRKDRIIPFIIDGEPHAADPARECYPPALSQLGDEEELLGISVEAYGQRGAFLRVIATLLHLKLDNVIARDAAWRRRRRILAILAAVLAVAVSAGLIWYNTPHTAAYRTAVEAWQVPVGIDKLSASQQASLDSFYRLTTLRGKVIQQDHVNSAGQLVVDSLFSDPPRLKYYYENGGKLSRVECYDSHGRLQFGMQFSADLRIVDFIQAENGYSFTLGAGVSSVYLTPENSATASRSDIIRYVQDYDENGHILLRMYKRDNRGSNGGTPVQDDLGSWGQSFTYDAQGRVTAAYYVDRDGNPAVRADGTAGIVIEYNDLGLPARQYSCDPNGDPYGVNNRAQLAYTYDALGRLIELNYLDNSGQPTHEAQGISTVRYTYDEHGFITSEAYFGIDGAPCYISGTCKLIDSYDEKGNNTRIEFLGANDQPVCHDKGYSIIEQEFDENGFIKYTRYLDTEGKPTAANDLKVYAVSNLYENGLLMRVDYQDTDGQPMLSGAGMATICYEYNDERLRTREWYLDTQGQPVRISEGYAAQAYEYTDGNVTVWRYLDEKGKPCPDSLGVSTYRYTFEAGLRTSGACFGAEDEPVLNSHIWHKVVYEYNEYGQQIRSSFYDTQGQLIESDSNYAVNVMTYDDLGRVETQAIYDAEGNPAQSSSMFRASSVRQYYDDNGNLCRLDYSYSYPLPNAISTQLIEHDSLGNPLCKQWLDADGNPVQNDDGYIREENEYDYLGRLTIKRQYSDPDTFEEMRYTYDEMGRTQHYEYETQGYGFATDSTYDAFGRLLTKTYMELDGTIQGTTRYGYDQYGNQTDIWCYAQDGQPITAADGYHHMKQAYNPLGLCILEEYYDTDDAPMEIDGDFRIVYQYDACGRLITREYYRLDNSFDIGYGWDYYPTGVIKREFSYNDKGREVSAWLRTPLVLQVGEDSPAAQAGIENGMMVMQYGNWTCDAILDQPETWRAQLSHEIQRMNTQQKTVTVAYLTDDFAGMDDAYTGLEFITQTFSEGLIGCVISESSININGLHWLIEGWHQYKARPVD